MPLQLSHSTEVSARIVRVLENKRCSVLCADSCHSTLNPDLMLSNTVPTYLTLLYVIIIGLV